MAPISRIRYERRELTELLDECERIARPYVPEASLDWWLTIERERVAQGGIDNSRLANVIIPSLGREFSGTLSTMAASLRVTPKFMYSSENSEPGERVPVQQKIVTASLRLADKFETLAKKPDFSLSDVTAVTRAYVYNRQSLMEYQPDIVRPGDWLPYGYKEKDFGPFSNPYVTHDNLSRRFFVLSRGLDDAILAVIARPKMADEVVMAPLEYTGHDAGHHIGGADRPRKTKNYRKHLIGIRHNLEEGAFALSLERLVRRSITVPQRKELDEVEWNDVHERSNFFTRLTFSEETLRWHGASRALVRAVAHAQRGH